MKRYLKVILVYQYILKRNWLVKHPTALICCGRSVTVVDDYNCSEQLQKVLIKRSADTKASITKPNLYKRATCCQGSCIFSRAINYLLGGDGRWTIPTTITVVSLSLLNCGDQFFLPSFVTVNRKSWIHPYSILIYTDVKQFFILILNIFS